jgi:hypothetical protein
MAAGEPRIWRGATLLQSNEGGASLIYEAVSLDLISIPVSAKRQFAEET